MSRAGAARWLAVLPLVAAAQAATPAGNPMHPQFAPLDEDGLEAIESGKAPDSRRTCGACHDVDAIEASRMHAGDGWRIDCTTCHWPAGGLTTAAWAIDEAGLYRREAIGISGPTDAACASCHVLASAGLEPLSIPGGWEASLVAPPTEPRYDLTRTTGTVFSAQSPGGSALNLAGKASLSWPWDAHARRLVGCTACHHAPNNPTHDARKEPLPFLANDPRHLGFADYLRAPDHDLATESCESCHAPRAAHGFLPFKDAHFRALDCRSCHVPALFGPAIERIDLTTLTADGLPIVEYRGVDPAPGESLNTAPGIGYRPFLLVEEGEGGGKIAPHNVVTRIAWIDRATGKEATQGQMRAAMIEGGSHAPAVIALFDADRDGRLSEEEARIDSPDKEALVAGRLRDLGLADPGIRVAIVAYPVRHGVQAGETVTRDCATCHARDSRIGAGIDLAGFVPPGAAIAASPIGAVRRGEGGLGLEPAADGRHVVGRTRGGLVDGIGFALFAITILGVAAHGGYRALTRFHGSPTGRPTRRAYMYTTYERIWHWLMAASILTLMVSGFAIHATGPGAWIPLSGWVSVHHAFAAIMTANAALSLFYHLASSAIRQFLPRREGLPRELKKQVAFYLQGIFLGQPHPTAKTEERRMNPLQQITYLALLNVLFPLQVATGALLYLANDRPAWIEALGGLPLIAPVHTMGSWLFITFFAVHLYLTTTGRTPLAYVRAMVTGFDEVDVEPAGKKGGEDARRD